MVLRWRNPDFLLGVRSRDGRRLWIFKPRAASRLSERRIPGPVNPAVWPAKMWCIVAASRKKKREEPRPVYCPAEIPSRFAADRRILTHAYSGAAPKKGGRPRRRLSLTSLQDGQIANQPHLPPRSIVRRDFDASGHGRLQFLVLTVAERSRSTGGLPRVTPSPPTIPDLSPSPATRRPIAPCPYLLPNVNEQVPMADWLPAPGAGGCDGHVGPVPRIIQPRGPKKNRRQTEKEKEKRLQFGRAPGDVAIHGTSGKGPTTFSRTPPAQQARLAKNPA